MPFKLIVRIFRYIKKEVMNRQSTQQTINDLISAWNGLISAWRSGYITDDELIEMTDLITGEVIPLRDEDYYQLFYPVA